MKILRSALAFALVLSGSPVGASETACVVPSDIKLENHDIGRMGVLEITRSKGLAAALTMDNSSERQIISDLFASDFTPIEDFSGVIGKYQCRTIKMGGNLPGIVYGWFNCEIFPEEAAMVVRKISGSQRFFGLLSPAGNGVFYRGASHYGYEQQVNFYGNDPERNQVGCLSAVGDEMDHFVLELPAPQFESVHDVIEMKRVN